MIRYVIRRILLLGVTMLITSVIIFGLTQLLPGDIARLQLGRDASQAQLEAFRVQYHLNLSVPEQYVRWLGGFLTGNWGISFSSGSPAVRPLVFDRLQNSLRLGLLTLILSVPLSIALGVLAALRENSWVDSVISVFSLGVVGLPEFVTGIVLISVFALGLGWFPATSLVQDNFTLGDWLKVLILPAVTATLVLLGYISRLTRAGVIEELKKPYVRTATLKGLSQRTVIVKHVLRNALLPTITVIALSVGWLIGGLIVIENVFNFPGLGVLLVTAVEQKNIPLLQAIVMVIIFFFAASNLIADILYAVLNPRIRLG
ncbi:MAG TPA: ABC transporter permease [Phototrophicaceae bacterium]|jgi:peptide/nickel transport system permease protein|nr:ABC transporter permease [Phototrophicaceae bacterium]